MADAEIRLSSGQAGQQFRDLSRKIRQAKDAGLQANLRKRIRDAGKPVVTDVQDAVRGLHVTSEGTGFTMADGREFMPASGRRLGDFQAASRRTGGGRKQRAKAKAERARSEKSRERTLRRGVGLRDSIAQATRLQVVSKGVRIVTSVKQLPEDQRTLPRHLDNPKGWRHPVFGNREVWVTQKGGPWFASTIQRQAPSFRAAMVQAMNDTRDEIAK